MSRTFFIARDELARTFDSPRAVRAFEEMQEKVAENDEALGANVEATDRMADATYVTLSPNAELPNEYVLQVSDGLRINASDGVARLILDAPVVQGGFRVTMVAAADTELVLPIAGVLATRTGEETLERKTLARPNLSQLVNAADDAAAAGAGVPVGGVYHDGGALRVRLA